MKDKKNKNIESMPSIEQLQTELKRVQHQKKYSAIFRGAVIALVAAAAVAVLLSTLWMPVLQIYGTSMSPTLKEGDVVISMKNADIRQGDVAAFYIGNKILIKRCIARSGQWVDIRENGEVYVDGERLEEPYLAEKAAGESDLVFPYQVPDDKYFFMGDHRSISVDSRDMEIGCVSRDQIVGKIIFRIWPLAGFGTLE